MEFKDYYDILGVSPDADSQSIKKAYRKKARQYHPDVSQHHNAEEKFKEASEAYEVLKDREKRAKYDALKQYGARGQDFNPPPGWDSENAYNEKHSAQFNKNFLIFLATYMVVDQLTEVKRHLKPPMNFNNVAKILKQTCHFFLKKH